MAKVWHSTEKTKNNGPFDHLIACRNDGFVEPLLEKKGP